MTATLPFHRWWIYQQERFPLAKHGPLIAVFSGAAVGYGTVLTGQEMGIALVIPALGAFVSSLGFFLLLRIADEFKDYAEDLRYRPYRPVPRGLVRRRELGWLGVGVGAVQLGLAVVLKPELVELLLLSWAYFGLMSREFFVGSWLRERLALYSFSHLVMVALIGLYAVAWAGLPPSWGRLVPFLLVCYGNGWVIELGRKIRLPAAEEPGVETYSARWGLGTACRWWLVAVGLTTLAALAAAYPIRAWTGVIGLVGPLLVGVLWWMWPLLWSRPGLVRFSPCRAPLDGPTALFTLATYLSLGGLPLLFSA